MAPFYDIKAGEVMLYAPIAQLSLILLAQILACVCVKRVMEDRLDLDESWELVEDEEKQDDNYTKSDG